MANLPTIGRDCQVVLLYNGARIDLEIVTGFTANQEVKPQRSDPLNGVPIEFNTPSGWRGRFMVDRGSSTLDDLIAAIEAAFWNAGTIGAGTIYQYVTERSTGALSTYEFSGVSLTLTDAGNYAAESTVKQTVGFFASLRTKIS